MVAKSKHLNRSMISQQAATRLLEDNKDLKLAQFARKKMKSTKSLIQLRKELGLECPN